MLPVIQFSAGSALSQRQQARQQIEFDLNKD
jgi:hypothetical protein